MRAVAVASILLAVDALDNGLGRTPPMGWSSWNPFADGPEMNATSIMGIADAIIANGLDKLGYNYVNIDCSWSLPNRAPDGSVQPDPVRFPNGIAAVAQYVHSKGLKLGIYSSHYTSDCCGGPGMYNHTLQDASTFAAWGVDYLKVDSCSGHAQSADDQWDHYAAIRDALDATGRPIYLSICPTSPNPPYVAPPCEPWGQNISYGPYQWVNGTEPAHTDPGLLANSILVEFCNNANNFDTVATIVDAQSQLGAPPSFARPGQWWDNDMLTIGCSDRVEAGHFTPCGAGPFLTPVEEQAQFSLWAMFTSPLILGNDLRYASPSTLSIISNSEVIGVNQDALGYRARLVYDAMGGGVNGKEKNREGAVGGGVSPSVNVAPCNVSDPSQQWTLPGDGSIRSVPTGQCLDVWDCGTAPETVVDVFDCHVNTPACGGASTSLNQIWAFTSPSPSSPNGTTITSALGNATSPLCLDVYDWSGPNVDLYPCHGTDNQAWTYNTESKSLVSAHTGYCLTTAQPHSTQIFAKQLADGGKAVALFNRGPVAVNMTVTWAMIQLEDPQPWVSADVRDLWAHATVGTGVQGGYTTPVDSHAVVLLKVTQTS